VPLVVQRVPLVLLVHHAVVTFQHATPTHAANGIISGILSKTEIEASFRRWVGGTFPSLCSGSTLDPILSQIRSNQDILSDGTNEPGVPCDAFSLGIGFTADEIAPPTACPKPNPCAKDASVPACDGG
jgi:hypothetical protein